MGSRCVLATVPRWCRRLVLPAFWSWVGVGGVASACRRPDPPPAQTAGAPVAHRGAENVTDSLYRLYRLQLVTDNPLLVGQQILCESLRLDSVLGENEARRRARQVAETVYTWRDIAARQRVHAALVGRSLTLSGSSCTPAGLALLGRPVRDSFTVIVAREVAGRHSIAASCAFRCEVLRLMVGRQLVPDEIATRLRPALAATSATRGLDANALIDSALTPSRAGCTCQGPE